MFTLATDVQKIIMEFLKPKDIKALYETCNDSKVMFEELTKHTNFIVVCNIIVSDNIIKWFELKNIKIKLLETFRKWVCNAHNGDHEGLSNRWYTNEKLHRDNDLPAVIYYDGEQKWYKDGKQIIK